MPSMLILAIVWHLSAPIHSYVCRRNGGPGAILIEINERMSELLNNKV